ncbi:hypothetical protein F4780DRAFT_465642 [Xylariomycetidae sp. FL0641]|nr:hypothetical protein F4780DRAFT_465642 [Xylariomycetidae sp. FL0641]
MPRQTPQPHPPSIRLSTNPSHHSGPASLTEPPLPLLYHYYFTRPSLPHQTLQFASPTTHPLTPSSHSLCGRCGPPPRSFDRSKQPRKPSFLHPQPCESATRRPTRSSGPPGDRPRSPFLSLTPIAVDCRCRNGCNHHATFPRLALLSRLLPLLLRARLEPCPAACHPNPPRFGVRCLPKPLCANNRPPDRMTADYTLAPLCDCPPQQRPAHLSKTRTTAPCSCPANEILRSAVTSSPEGCVEGTRS